MLIYIWASHKHHLDMCKGQFSNNLFLILIKLIHELISNAFNAVEKNIFKLAMSAWLGFNLTINFGVLLVLTMAVILITALKMRYLMIWSENLKAFKTFSSDLILNSSHIWFHSCLLGPFEAVLSDLNHEIQIILRISRHIWSHSLLLRNIHSFIELKIRLLLIRLLMSSIKIFSISQSLPPSARIFQFLMKFSHTFWLYWGD